MGKIKTFVELILKVNKDLGYLYREEPSEKFMEQEDVLGLTANRLRLTAINITNQESTMAVVQPNVVNITRNMQKKLHDTTTEVHKT
jgi:hypothetical protein